MKKLCLLVSWITLLSIIPPFGATQETKAKLLLSGISSDRLALPTSVECDKAGNIYVVSSGTHEIVSYTKDLKLRFRVGGSGIGTEALVDPQDMLFVKDSMLVSDAGCIKIFDTNGNFQKNIEKIKDTALVKPTGMIQDSRGRIYICDAGTGKIFILESSLDTYKILEGYKQPISFFPVNDNYYLLEKETKTLTIFSSMMAKIKTIEGFKNPQAMSTDFAQKIFVLDGSEIKMFTLAGLTGKTLSFAPKSSSAYFNSFGFDGSKYIVSSTASHELLSIDDTGKLTILIAHEVDKLCLPQGLAVDENGRIFVSDSGNKMIRVTDQRGTPLFQIDNIEAGKMAISKDLVAIVTADSIKVLTRAGQKAYDIQEPNVIDVDFDLDGSLLALKKDALFRYQGTTKTETVLAKQDWGKPTSISSIGTNFAITDQDNSKVMIYSGKDTQSTIITLSDSPLDCILLSPQRIIVSGESSMKLVDQSGKVLRSFGNSGGPFSLHKPTTDKIAYETGLDTMTEPAALASFGKWLYLLDRQAMRLIRYPREMLLESPKIKITPEIADFKFVTPDSEEELELVIQNIGGDSLEGYFTNIPKWISLSTRTVKGDEVIIKVKAKTYHFIPSVTYRESMTLESNAGRFKIPCILKTPDSLPAQVNVEFQIGNKTITINGKKVDQPVAPYIKDAATMVPLQFLTDTFGAVTDFSSGYISINFPRKNIWVVCEVGSNNVTLQRDDQTSSLTMKPSPEVKSGKACLSLSFFTDILDCELYWDKATKKIRLIYLP